MRLLLMALLSLVIALPADAGRYVFREPQQRCLAYLDVLSDDGVGALWLGGYRFPLIGFDCWLYAGIALPSPSMHMVLVYHPKEPWVVGFILWDGLEGKLEIFSTDGVRFEYPLRVEVAPDHDGRYSR